MDPAERQGMKPARITHHAGGTTREFDCAPTWLSVVVSEAILRGETYPDVPFVGPVDVVLDAGANCGAATVFFAANYPDAVVHAFEPGADALLLLEHNTRDLPNVRINPVGLHSQDQEVLLYRGGTDISNSSIFPVGDTTAETESIQVRSAAGWLREHSIEHVDILKLDTEGCEVPILEDLGASMIEKIKVVYLEYHSEPDRKRLDELLDASHLLVFGRNYHRTGELTYINRSAFDPDGSEITDWIADIYSRELAATMAGRREELAQSSSPAAQ